jgi:hypothetical protein
VFTGRCGFQPHRPSHSWAHELLQCSLPEQEDGVKNPLARTHSNIATMKFRISPAQELAGVLGVAGSKRLPAFRKIFIPIFALACALLMLTGCGALESRTQRLTLSDSGFLARVPETERQRDFYAALPPYKLYAGVKNGQPFYVYKDEKAGVIYVGNEQDYQRYMVKVRRLIAYYETTEAKMVAHKIDDNLQSRWDGSWSRAN